jgi:sugar lactone lactonase YvrE
MNISILPVCDHPSILGEGPVWDSRQQSLLWVDIVSCCIHEYNPAKDTLHTIPTVSMPGAVAIRDNGHLVAALQNGFAFINRFSGQQHLIHDPEVHLPQNRFNDGKCDAWGRFWAGTMSQNEKDPSGSMYLLDNHLQTKTIFQGVTISNGLCWSSDGQQMYYIDTPTLRVDRFDMIPESGQLSNRQTVIEINEREGYPDGMTMDAEGMLWIAHWGGWQITRWNPHTGEQLTSIHLPASQITSLCFGGEQLDEIYVTSARRGLDEIQLTEEPWAGCTFRVKNSGFSGSPAHTFKQTNLS